MKVNRKIYSKMQYLVRSVSTSTTYEAGADNGYQRSGTDWTHISILDRVHNS